MPHMSPERNPPGPAGIDPRQTPDSERILDSAELLAGRLEIVIRHGRKLYRLRRTRSGKLILTA
jgi:hemin uptake protein HemP